MSSLVHLPCSASLESESDQVPQSQNKLSTFSRPEAVGWWFRHGRRDFTKIPPNLKNPEYGVLWIGWWTRLQPTWRNTVDWPFPQTASPGDLWDDLLIGGKDGIFIVIMTLAWWSIEHKKSGEESSTLDEAIEDVSWVLSHLVFALSAENPPSVTPGSSRYRRQVPKIGPPNKRSRLSRS